MQNQAQTPETIVQTPEQNLKEYLSKTFNFNEKLQVKFLLSLMPIKFDKVTVEQLRDALKGN